MCIDCNAYVDTDKHPDSYDYGQCLCPRCMDRRVEQNDRDREDRIDSSVVRLALATPHRVVFHQRGLGREVVAVQLLDNKVTPYATYELAGEDFNGARFCVSGEYLYNEAQAIRSIGRRTGVNLEVRS
jgi:hypothetical protein